jgi:hypothetical protein
VLAALTARSVRAYCAPRAAAFRRSLAGVAAAQTRVLKTILRGAATTRYGRERGLSSTDDVASFQAKIEPCSYASLSNLIEEQRKSGEAIVTPGRVRCYEPTSGSAGPAKRIAYNDALLASFRSAFSIWAHDLLTHALRPRTGRMFMSVSPRTTQERGLADDSAYLGGPLRLLLRRFMVASDLRGAHSPEQFRDALACALVGCADLEIVSVWNPSYLLLVMEHFAARREALLPRIARKRRRVLEQNTICWPEVWPNLQFVSCWDSAAAAGAARQLAALLPHARLQGKGLLATEAPISVPLFGVKASVPLVDEVFIELADEHGNVRLLHECEIGKTYSLIVTQAGGLLRYCLGDRVGIVGRHLDAPLLEFLGRTDAVCDLVGEKLHEDFVAQALRESIGETAFCLLAPVVPPRAAAHYVLLTDDQTPQLGPLVDARLRRALRYDEARSLGQLESIEVVAHASMRRVVHDFLIADGLAAGDIKDRALITNLKQATALRDYVQAEQGADR